MNHPWSGPRPDVPARWSGAGEQEGDRNVDALPCGITTGPASRCDLHPCGSGEFTSVCSDRSGFPPGLGLPQVAPGSPWDEVRQGLGQLFGALLVIWIVALALEIGPLLLEKIRFPWLGRVGYGLEVCLIALAICVQLPCGLFACQGVCLCCKVPRDSRAGGWAVGTIIALVGFIVALFVLGFGGAAIHSLRKAPLLARVGAVSAGGLLLLGLFGGWFCWIMLLRAVARYWGARRLGRTIVVYGFVCWVYLLNVGAVLSLFTFARIPLLPYREGRVAEKALLALGVALWCWGLVLLWSLRRAIPIEEPGRAPGNLNSHSFDGGCLP
jgi:hypothetical protein